MIKGSCLCQAVKFSVDGKYSEIEQCHCSKCRKVSGTNSNAVLTTTFDSFTWECGSDLLKIYEMADGWRSTFCTTCGCPVPMYDEDEELFWIPAGLLDDDPGVSVTQHIFTGSKVRWDVIGGDAAQFDEDAPRNIYG